MWKIALEEMEKDKVKLKKQKRKNIVLEKMAKAKARNEVVHIHILFSHQDVGVQTKGFMEKHMVLLKQKQSAM